MNWLEVSLTVDGELAEAVAEVLARFVPGGVVVESTAIYADPFDEGYPVGPLRVCGYIPVDAQLEDTRQRIEEALYFLGRIQPLPDPEFKPIEEVNWAEAWKQHYQPIAIGKQLMIVPAWLESPDQNRIPIRIDPGMAFGTGTHPTTQLCLELLEVQLFEKVELLDVDIIDIGCGSGILSIAAIKLGAQRAFGVDTDPEAITAAKQNATDNNVVEQIEFAVGSVAEVLEGVFPVKQAPIVLVNILAPIIMRLLDAGLGDLVAPDGDLLLSGILEDQLPEMEAALEKLGFSVSEKRQIDDWVGLAVTR